MEFDYFLVSNICLTLSQYLILPFQNLTTTRYLQLIHSFTFIYQCCFLKFIKMQNQPKKSIKIKYGSKYQKLEYWNLISSMQGNSKIFLSKASGCNDVLRKFDGINKVVATMYCNNLRRYFTTNSLPKTVSFFPSFDQDWHFH